MMIWKKLPSKFDKLDVAIDPSDIEDCHWLKSHGPKKVIITFARRKDANLIRKNKNKLKGMNLCSVGIIIQLAKMQKNLV